MQLREGEDDNIDDEPQGTRLGACIERESGAGHDQVGKPDEEKSKRELGRRRHLRSVSRLPRPQPDQNRSENKDHQWIEGEKPCRGEVALPEAEIDVPVGEIFSPKYDRIALLLVARPEKPAQQENAKQAADHDSLAAVELSRDGVRSL